MENICFQLTHSSGNNMWEQNIYCRLGHCHLITIFSKLQNCNQTALMGLSSRERGKERKIWPRKQFIEKHVGGSLEPGWALLARVERKGRERSIDTGGDSSWTAQKSHWWDRQRPGYSFNRVLIFIKLETLWWLVADQLVISGHSIFLNSSNFSSNSRRLKELHLGKLFFKTLE